MSKDPEISVIITTCNRREKLRRAINSVLTQTFTPIEIIVVDNASTDKTFEMIKDIQADRLQYIRHQQNLGGPAARNSGIRAARAKFIAFLDDDDQWMPTKLEKQYQKMNEGPSSIGLVYAGAEVFDEVRQKVTQVNKPQYKGNVHERLLLGTILSSVSSVLVRKECFDRVGLFDESLTSCQDWDMWLRISVSFEFDFVEDILTRINMHGFQISANYAALIPGRTRMIEKHAEEFKGHPGIYVVHLKRVGKLHCINGTWKLAWPWFKKAVAIRPLESVKIFFWCLFELPMVKFFSPARSFKRYVPQT